VHRLLSTVVASHHVEHGLKSSAASLASASQLVRAFASTATVSTTREARPFLQFGGIRFIDTLRHVLRDYKQLSKAKLSALVVATCAAGYVAGSKERVDWKELGWVSFGTFLASSSANSLNQIYEVANDARMKRTAGRPLPAGRMSRIHAAAFAILTGGTGLWILSEKTNETTACLGAGNIALYAGVYTPLKQISVVNTWVGAVVGAIPPLMGWAAAAAGDLDAGSLILGAGLYFWQMPHFMSLAWLCRADYAAGGYRMLSLIDATGKRTAACALRNCAYLFPLGALAAWLGVTSPYFAYESGKVMQFLRFFGSLPSLGELFSSGRLKKRGGGSDV
jgi:protoheme IX farnesyltransferase